MATNDITGDSLISKTGNKAAFDEGWDRIFGKKEKHGDQEEVPEHGLRPAGEQEDQAGERV